MKCIHSSLLCILVTACAFRSAASFSIPAFHPKISKCTLSESNNYDDWDMGDEYDMDDDPTEGMTAEELRLKAMRILLENSWDGKAMGTVPTTPEKAAAAAAESVALAMGRSHNVMMIDLMLPSYDILEGPKFYDQKAVYDFCTSLTSELVERKLITRSLILVRNDKERRGIERAIEKTVTGESSYDMARSQESDDVVDFRQQLLNSWDSGAPPKTTEITMSTSDPNSNHRLWSMVGREEISTGSDMFDQVIAAVDKHARLDMTKQEDAIIIVSPYDTADIIAVRRILARYGQTRTIIFINSRMETLPVEMSNAVMVYGMMPLVARARNSENDNDDEPGLKAVVMKRFPDEWSLFIDVFGDGFVRAKDRLGYHPATSNAFPPPEWIARNVQYHVEGLQ
jgi:hypothetical protein